MGVYVCPSFVRFHYSGLPCKKLKSDYNQTWVKDAIAVPSYLNKSKVTYQG